MNGVKRLPRRKYVPRNPNLLTYVAKKTTEIFQEELEDGEIPRLTEEIVTSVQNPLNSLMAQISTLDQPKMIHHPPVQIKNECRNDSSSPIEFTLESIVKQEEITVTPDLHLLSDIDTPYDNQISLKKIRATSFPCPLCPNEATQGK